MQQKLQWAALGPLLRKGMMWALYFVGLMGCLGILGLLGARWWVVHQTQRYIYPLAEVPPQPVALVFGAGLWRDGTPTPVLRDRVATGADLYFTGKVKVLLLSGDNRFVTYNEPAAMQRYAAGLGVPEHVMVLDYAGRRTYDTCYRARAIFGVDRVIVVTQRFHLARAIYTCRALGLDAVGVPADRRRYHTGSYLYWNLREWLATARALLDVHVLHPTPVLGQPEPIFPEGIHDRP